MGRGKDVDRSSSLNTIGNTTSHHVHCVFVCVCVCSAEEGAAAAPPTWDDVVSVLFCLGISKPNLTSSHAHTYIYSIEPQPTTTSATTIKYTSTTSTTTTTEQLAHQSITTNIITTKQPHPASHARSDFLAAATTTHSRLAIASHTTYVEK